MNSHSRPRVLSVLSQLVLSLLFVTTGMCLNTLVAGAQDNPSATQKKTTITLSRLPHWPSSRSS